jgi:FtsH-binding integral membrane protein
MLNSYAYPTMGNALTKEEQNTLLRSVYNWMTLGLFISGLTAYWVAASPAMQQMIFGNSITVWVLFLAELGLVFTLSGAIQRLSSGTAATLFLVFSFINGLTLSSIFLIYTMSSIASTFFITAITFGVVSLYGYVTKADLTSLGKYLFMALIGLIIASVVNIFMHSSTLNWIVSFAGIIIFTGLTAWDTQKIKRLGEQMIDRESENFKKLAILGSLTLYLDFVNLFLFMLNFMGRRD